MTLINNTPTVVDIDTQRDDSIVFSVNVTDSDAVNVDVTSYTREWIMRKEPRGPVYLILSSADSPANLPVSGVDSSVITVTVDKQTVTRVGNLWHEIVITNGTERQTVARGEFHV